MGTTIDTFGNLFFFRSNEEFIGGDVEDMEEEERDELADLPDRVDGSGGSGLLNPKLTTIDIRQVKRWRLKDNFIIPKFLD